MFLLIESKEEIAKAQRNLETSICRDFKEKKEKNIGYPGGTMTAAQVQTDGTYWFYSSDCNEEDVNTPRRLNWFGLLRDSPSLDITVEINTVYEGRNDRIAGFFARDSNTGSIYLMHSGRVGGGTKGVGKEAFLACSGERLFEVMDSSGRIKEGTLVMPIKGNKATRPAIHYIDAIIDFKQAVRNGVLTSTDFQKKKKQYNDFFAEARGRRLGQRSGEIDYLSRHGEVVDALYLWRNSNRLPKSRRLVKDRFIDFGVTVEEELIEVYEVKTSTARTNIYTAIGQLMTHGVSKNCRRLLVLPDHEMIASDLVQTLKRLNIELLKFKFYEESVTII